MAIKIARIEVEQLGPLVSFKNDLRDVTLIYGGNEKGKTFLVEFVLKSLFKNLTGFKNELRIKKPGGKIVVSGFGTELVTFSPGSRVKLESKLEESGQSMPANIARLLVVRGGDTAIEKSDDGISQDAIREFLSSQGVLDTIQRNIPLKGTREARIEAGEILGSNSGDLSKRKDARDGLENITRLLERVNLELAEGDIVALDKRITQAKERLDRLEAARKYAAYQLAQEKQKVESEIKRMEDANFKGLEKNFEDYLRQKRDLAAMELEMKDAEQRGQHHPWLQEAIDEYQNHIGKTSAIARPIYLIVALILILASSLFIAFGQRLPAIVAVLLAAGSGFWYFQQARRYQRNQAETKEIERIRETYIEKFNEPCKDLATMRVKLAAIASDYHGAQQIAREIEKIQADIKKLENAIHQGLKDLGKNRTSPDLWENIIKELRRELSNLHTNAQVLDKDLARLDVDPSDYQDSDPGITYSRAEYNAAKAEKEQLELERTNLEQSLQNLKSEIQGVVREHSLTDWGELIQRLRELKQEQVEQFLHFTVEIIAGNLLYRVIEQAHMQEDEKIRANLDSDIVRGPLKDITKRYVSVEIEDGSFKAIDTFNQEFDLADLSTGTREQIFLALRIGFAKRIMQGDTAFLILDDAFQHSDWERRHDLVDTVFDLAKQGWQIIYFSMDDNIRDLFDQKGKKAPKDTYVRIDL
jgi:hypothetical protein